MAYRDSTSNAGNSTTPSVAVPAGVVAGDIVIVIIGFDATAAVVDAADLPTGFVELAETDISADGHTAWIGYKRLTAADTGSYTFGSVDGFASDWVCQAFAFSGRSPPVVSTVALGNTLVSNPTVTANGVTASTGDDLLYVSIPDRSAGTGTASHATPAGYTAAEAQHQSWSYAAGAYKENVSAGATGTVGAVFTSSVTAGYAAWLVRLPVVDTWSFIGVSTVVPTTTTTLTLTEPAGVASGDLLVACIANRQGATTATTLPTGWASVFNSYSNSTGTSGTALASATMAYIIRGSSAPALGFTLGAANVGLGQIVAYRGSGMPNPLDSISGGLVATGTTLCNVGGPVTTKTNDLIVAMAAGGQEAAWSVFTNTTSPLTASGATNITSAPSATAWIERADSLTTSGSDTSLAIFDAVRTTTGALGDLTVTASVAAGHVILAGAFRIVGSETADAWNANDKTSIVVSLSASDKTATSTAAGVSGIRSATTRANGTAGKYYAEILATTYIDRIGINPTSGNLTGTTSNFHFYSGSGLVLVNSGSSGVNIGTPSNGDVICIAWDAGAERVWFRRNAGNWNNNASYDPGAGTGGIDVSFAASTAHALWVEFGAASLTATIRTELAEFTQTVPSGFNSWMDEASGPTAYTLPAVAGSYALTGTVANLERSRLVTALPASYALTGADATLTKGVALVAYNLPAVAGSYALTGVIAGLYRGREVLALPATYALTGTTASLEYGREVLGVAGSYALAGQTASLELGKEVLALAGSYALTGQASTLLRSYRPVAVSGSYSLTGTDATLTKGAAIVHRTLAADQGAYALTGAAASLERGREVVADPATYALTGAVASLERGHEVAAIAGSYALTGTAATFRRTWKAVAVSGSYTLAGLPANLLKPGAYAIAALPGSYALTGAAATLTKSELAGLVSIWNGSAWVDKPAKVWTGSAWTQKPVKHWNGSAWV